MHLLDEPTAGKKGQGNYEKYVFDRKTYCITERLLGFLSVFSLFFKKKKKVICIVIFFTQVSKQAGSTPTFQQEHYLTLLLQKQLFNHLKTSETVKRMLRRNRHDYIKDYNVVCCRKI